MLCVAQRREAEAAARWGVAAAGVAAPPRADRARGVERRKGSDRRRDGDEAAARRGVAAAVVAAPPRVDRARRVERRKGAIRRRDGDEAAARWGVAAAVAAVPPRADRARGVEHRKGPRVCALPSAVTLSRHRRRRASSSILAMPLTHPYYTSTAPRGAALASVCYEAIKVAPTTTVASTPGRGASISVGDGLEMAAWRWRRRRRRRRRRR